MALTLTVVADQEADWGPIPVKQYTAQPGSSDYPSGGYAITPANVGLRLISAILVIGATLAAGGALTTVSIGVWNYGTGKLQFFKSNTASDMTEESGSADLSALTFKLLVLGQR